MSCKAAYLKNNKQRFSYADKYTDAYVELVKQAVQQKSKISDVEPDTFFIVVDGKKMDFAYEEMVELLSAMHSCNIGNECFLEAKIKAEIMAKFLPVTDY